MSRCIGITREFKRCKKDSQWLCFCYQHRWQVITATLAIIGLASSLVGLYGFLQPGPSNKIPRPGKKPLELALNYQNGTADGKVNIEKAYGFFESAAATGDPVAQMWKASHQLTGNCLFKRNIISAQERILELRPSIVDLATKQNDLQSQLILGFHFGRNSKNEHNKRLAKRWLKKAAKHNHPDAFYELGILSAFDRYDSINSSLNSQEGAAKKGEEYLEEAIKLGHIPALTAKSLIRAKMGKEKEAVDGLNLAIEKGDTTAMYLLAHLYRKWFYDKEEHQIETKGLSIQADELIRKAAKMGNLDAMNMMGLIELQRGTFFFPDPNANVKIASRISRTWKGNIVVTRTTHPLSRDSLAKDRFQEAAKRGSAKAMNNLGVLYYNERGINNKKEKAIPQFQKAALFGDETTRYFAINIHLPNIYANKLKELDPNNKDTLRWFRDEAYDDDAAAMTVYGTLLEKSRTDEAVKWHKEAMNKGSVWGAVHLSLLKANDSTEPEGRSAIELLNYAESQCRKFDDNYSSLWINILNIKGQYYESGIRGVPANEQKALEIYSQINEPFAQEKQAWIYLKGTEKIDPNLVRASSLFYKAKSSVGLIAVGDAYLLSDDIEKASKHYLSAAHLDNNNVGIKLLKVADILLHRNVDEEDFQTACEYYAKAITFSEPNSIDKLLYAAENNKKEFDSFSWKIMNTLRDAASHGNKYAMKALGDIYCKGLASKHSTDYSTCIGQFIKTQEKHGLGGTWDARSDVSDWIDDYEEAHQWYVKAMNASIDVQQTHFYELAKKIAYGHYILGNKNDSVSWYHKELTLLKDPNTIDRLDRMYWDSIANLHVELTGAFSIEGQETENPNEDPVSASVAYFREWASKGDTAALSFLGINLWQYGGEESKEESLSCLRDAAKKDIASAIVFLLLINGSKAENEPGLLDIAAKKDHPYAYYLLAKELEDASDTSGYERIVNLYRKAAQKNCCMAANRLCLAYGTGELGLKQDFDEAFSYANMAFLHDITDGFDTHYARYNHGFLFYYGLLDSAAFKDRKREIEYGKEICLRALELANLPDKKKIFQTDGYFDPIDLSLHEVLHDGKMFVLLKGTSD